MKAVYLLISVIIIISGCSHTVRQSENTGKSNKYAKGFSTEVHDDYTKLTIHNPWGKADNISFEYYLFNRNDPVPDSLRGKKIIRTPVERLICLSTTHLAFLEALNETHTVTGISGIKYISNPEIRKKFKEGKIPDVGYGQNLNYELLVRQNPDLVMVYALGSDIATYAYKLDELGIPVIIFAEYLEETPLGKAEWIKFIGHLFDKEPESVKYFNKVEQKYLYLKKIVAGKSPGKPKVMVGSPYKDTWWVPGGNSYMANLINDAGGYYLGNNNHSHESYIISFENALTWGNEAEIWINTGNLATKREILGIDSRFENFRVFREGKIYNNIKRLSPYGGNDFWESGTVNPHLILSDLINIFHPGLINNDMVYYKEIR